MSIEATRNYRRFSILFVDDEEKTRKYFNRAFSDEMTVITASSAEQALQILSDNADSIGVLITDQRMPNQNGVDLLKQVRQDYPGITRILTTAYTELDDAIAAVNSGEIFRYITKPWDIRILRGELLRAMDYFIVQHERDLLVKEKLSVWQKLSYTNHLRDLLVMAAGFTHIRYPLPAIISYLSQFSSTLNYSGMISSENARHADIWDTMLADITHMHGLIKYLLQVTSDENGYSEFGHELDINECLLGVVEVIRRTCETNILFESSNEVAYVKANSTLMKRFFLLLLESLLVAVKTGGHISLRVKNMSDVNHKGRNNRVHIIITCDSCLLLQDKEQGDIDTTQFQHKMLAAFFVCFHHAGDIRINVLDDTGLKIDVEIPFEPTSVTLEEPDEDRIRAVIEQYENMMIANSAS